MINTIAIGLFLLFTYLSSIHFYWAFGGKWAAKNVLPSSNNESKPIKQPSTFSTLMVALVLLFFGMIYLDSTHQTKKIFSDNISRYIIWGIAILFTLRAIGDFNYLGFFKKIKNTGFAKNDTQLYAPLCLLIAVLSIIILLA